MNWGWGISATVSATVYLEPLVLGLIESKVTSGAQSPVYNVVMLLTRPPAVLLGSLKETIM